MVNNGRRKLIFSLPALAVLIGCQGLNNALAPEEGLKQNKVLKRSVQSVSDFLDSRFSTSYTSDPDWMVEGLLLTSFGNWGVGDYKYFVNGQYMTGPINLRGFDSSVDRMRIEKMINGSWKKVWSWPRRKTHYIPHEQEIPEP